LGSNVAADVIAAESSATMLIGTIIGADATVGPVLVLDVA
jgi:hypothetical protein